MTPLGALKCTSASSASTSTPASAAAAPARAHGLGRLAQVLGRRRHDAPAPAGGEVRRPRPRTSGGRAVVQASSTNSQRGAKMQPGGSSSTRGIAPGIVTSERFSGVGSKCGTQPSRSSVYGCSGRVKSSRRLGLLHELAGVHHADAVADLGDHAEVVGDVEDRRVELPLELGDEVEDDGLGGDVQGRRRLVHDEQRRVGHERHGDDAALQHAAGELVRVALHHRFGVGHGDLGEHLDDARHGGARVHARGAGAPPRRAACR